MKLISLIPVVAVGGLLLFAAKDFPEWGDPASPASTSPVSSHFIQNTGVDTEVPNMVTAVLADYRGFDTMFETVVVFIAGMAVLAILKGSGRRRSGKREHEVEAEPDLIVTNTVRLIVPAIQIFAGPRCDSYSYCLHIPGCYLIHSANCLQCRFGKNC